MRCSRRRQGAAEHRLFRIEGGELEENQQAFGLVRGIDFWDGAQWNPREALGQAGPCGWESVHGTSRSYIHLRGAQGRLARFDGTSWRLLAAPVPVNVHALWVKSPLEDPQGRWTEVLQVGPSRTVTRLRSSGGKLMVSERLLDRGRWQASLWVGR